MEGKIESGLEENIKVGFNSHNSNKLKTVAILGGSFDPPTISHIQVASEIYNTYLDVDEVWITPCGDGRGDKSLRTKGIHRIKMVDLILKDIIGDNAPIKVNDIEIRNSKYYPTYDLLQELKIENPGYKFIFCMGTDLLPYFRQWDERLYYNEEFIIIRRPGYDPLPEFFPVNYRFVDTIIDGSSTKVRSRIKEQIEQHNKINLAVNGLTTVSVISYIIENKLYQI